MTSQLQPDLDEIFAEVGRIYRAEPVTQLDLEKLTEAKAAINQYALSLVRECLDGKTIWIVKGKEAETDRYCEIRDEFRQEALQRALELNNARLGEHFAGLRMNSKLLWQIIDRLSYISTCPRKRRGWPCRSRGLFNHARCK